MCIYQNNEKLGFYILQVAKWSISSMIYIKGTYFAEIRSNTQFLNNGATKYALRRRVELNWTITFHSGYTFLHLPHH